MQINQFIDHTLLKNDATEVELKQLVKEAVDFNFYSVCVHPYFVPFVQKLSKGSNLKIGAVAGYPLGMGSLKTKIFEVEELNRLGIDEIDYVANIALIKSKAWKELLDELTTVRNTAPGILIKVIIESSALTEAEIRLSCQQIIKANIEFAKSSTGFYWPGAQLDHIQIMVDELKDTSVKVKASGGIKTYEQAKKFIDLGCSRIGTSSSVNIVNEN